jgi:hypothetical protein
LDAPDGLSGPRRLDRHLSEPEANGDAIEHALGALVNALRIAVVFALSLLAVGLAFAAASPGALSDQPSRSGQYESGREHVHDPRTR